MKVKSNEKVEVIIGDETIQIKRYIVDFYKSRKKSLSSSIRCEIEGCNKQAVDIHHIESSYRGQRMHEDDGSDLIWLCRKHHEHIHNNNNYEKRAELKERVKKILEKLAI